MTIDLFYRLKPFIPRCVQVGVRRQMVGQRLRANRGRWPVFEAAGSPPPEWPGWPGGKRFALVLTHDVESEIGVSRCEHMADLEEARNLRSAFAFVPLRYRSPFSLQRSLADRGFEVLVHDLYHDGKMYRSREEFSARRGPINSFLRDWGVRGFASGAMHHNLRWISELEIDYDISTYDVDPFEPQRCGMARIFPFWVQSPDGAGRGFVEIPYTMPQDFTLFVLMRERSAALWRTKLDWIAAQGGMALVKTHPDYIAFHAEDGRVDRYPVAYYLEFLDYLRERYAGEFWLAHPSEVARYWRSLAVGASADARPITSSPMFCPSCQQAHVDGWLRQYPTPCGVGCGPEKKGT